MAFAVPPNSAKTLVAACADPLRSDFGTHRDFRTDLAAATRPVTIFSGAEDELMIPEKYADAVRGVGLPVDVKLIPGADRIGYRRPAGGGVFDPRRPCATRGMTGS